MASEKEAALAAVPSDSPTIFDEIINQELPSDVVSEHDKVLEGIDSEICVYGRRIIPELYERVQSLEEILGEKLKRNKDLLEEMKRLELDLALLQAKGRKLESEKLSLRLELVIYVLIAITLVMCLVKLY